MQNVREKSMHIQKEIKVINFEIISRWSKSLKNVRNFGLRQETVFFIHYMCAWRELVKILFLSIDLVY